VSRRLENANGALSRSANQMPVFLALGQSGISNFALVRKKIKKKCPLSQPISIQSFCSLCYKFFRGKLNTFLDTKTWIYQLS